MFSRLAKKSLFALPVLVLSSLAACAAPVAEEEAAAGSTDATEDELRAGGCISGDKMLPNIYDMGDVPEFTQRSSARFGYSPASRVVSNAGAPGCETLPGSLKAQCQGARFTANGTAWGPKDEASGRLLLSVSNGGGGFLMIAPKDFVYCSANPERDMPPRIVLKKTLHVQLTPEGFDPRSTPAQIDAMTSSYCRPGTFDRATFQCVARDGVTVDVSTYVKTPVAGGACALPDGAPSGVTGCSGDLTCQNGKWQVRSCASVASSSRSFCSRKGYCESSMSFPAEDAPCSNPAGTPSWSTGCGKVLTAGAPIEFTCQDGFWAKQSCASRASSSRSYCSDAGYCDSVGH